MKLKVWAQRIRAAVMFTLICSSCKCGEDPLTQMWELSITPRTVDFGEAMVGSERRRILEVRNEGQISVSLTSQIVSGEGRPSFFVSDDSLNFTLAPGELRIVGVGFGPFEVGVKTATLTFSPAGDAAHLRGLGAAITQCGPCDAPPGSRCDDNYSVSYDETGTCISDACTYGENRILCSDGCDNATGTCRTIDGGLAETKPDATEGEDVGLAFDAETFPDAEEADTGEIDAGIVVPEGCADGTVEQVFAPDMVGCDGAAAQCAVNFCASGWDVCTFSQYVAKGGMTIAPNNDRWIFSCIRNSQPIGCPSESVCTFCSTFEINQGPVGWDCAGNTVEETIYAQLALVSSANTPTGQPYRAGCDTAPCAWVRAAFPQELLGAVCCDLIP